MVSFAEIQPYILKYESGGRNIYNSKYSINPNYYTASGYYQITNSTWRGVPSSITQGYPTAISAPFDVQTAAAENIWNRDPGAWLGHPDLGYAGNSKIIAAYNQLASGNNPGGGIDPGNIGGSSSVIPDITMQQNIDNYGYFGATPIDPYANTPYARDPLSVGSVSDYGYFDLNPPDTSLQAGTTGGPDPYNMGANLGNAVGGVAQNLATGGQSSGSAWWNWFTTVTIDVMQRFGLIILGVVLIAGAAWALSRENNNE